MSLTESNHDQKDIYRPQPGDLVLVREAHWRVTHVRGGVGAPIVRVVTLRGADRENRWQECTLLEPFDRFAAWSRQATRRVVSRRWWMHALGALAASTGAELNATLPHGVLAIADANVALLNHQMAPLLAVLQGTTSRVLIADGVGLGKTVQAALVLRALAARGRAGRVLIAVPAGLREQWREELRERVGLAADVIDAATLAARVRQLPSDVNPWTPPGIVIASLDFLKQDVILHGLSAISWDALVVDEAHALTTGTDRAAAAHLLAQHSGVVLLLTATPHAGSDAAFDAVCRIGKLVDRNREDEAGAEAGAEADADAEAARGDPIAIFRRTRASLGLPSARRVHVLRVRPTPAEQHLHALLTRYVSRVEREGRAEGPATLAMSVLQKRATSSAWSLLRSLERRVELLSRERAADAQSAVERQAALPFEAGSEEDPADEEPLAWLSAPGLANVQVERAWLSLLIQIARRAAHHESKLRALRRLLRRVREPTIIYTEYRDTLAHVVDTLPDDRALSAATLHGGLTREARTDALRAFTSGDANLLFATDAAGEGLNLHHRSHPSAQRTRAPTPARRTALGTPAGGPGCRLVINVELPWNPNRLEQRLGRVDRLGQSRTVHAFHFVLSGTSEEALLATLNDRVESIATALGERPAVLEGHAQSTGERRKSVEAAEPRGPSAAPVPPAPVPPATVTPAPLPPMRVWPDLSAEADAVVRALEYVRALRTSSGRGDRSRRRGDRSRKRNGKHGLDLELDALELDARAPGIATVRSQRRGPLADLAPGVLYIWRTHIRIRDPASDTARELITPLHVPCTHAASDLRELMERRLDALARSTIEAWNKRERDFQERAMARDAAISRSLRAMRVQLDERSQPLLFADIAADREARRPTHWRSPPLGSRSRYEPPRPKGADGQVSPAASGADVDHTLLLVLVLR